MRGEALTLVLDSFGKAHIRYAYIITSATFTTINRISIAAASSIQSHDINGKECGELI